MTHQDTQFSTGRKSAAPAAVAWTGLLPLALLLLLALPPTEAAGQCARVAGVVLDEHSRAAIADVHVFSGIDSMGTVTDAAGNFLLRLGARGAGQMITFRHLGYDTLSIPCERITPSRPVLLRPRIIGLQSTEISGQRPPERAVRELRFATESIDAQRIESYAPVDAGEFLRTHVSMRVEEDVSGRKELSMRGGNSDDVVILHDGVLLSDGYARGVDLGGIELEGVERLDIIRSANSVLVGQEAFSGVVNIVPRDEQPFHVRVWQQIGSYDAGLWGAQLHHRLGRWNASYSVRNGGTARAFADAPDALLGTSLVQHQARLRFRVPAADGDAGTVTAQFRYSDQEYDNQRDEEFLRDRLLLAALRYTGDVGPTTGWTGLLAATRALRMHTVPREQRRTTREVREDGVQSRLDKSWDVAPFSLLASWQLSASAVDIPSYISESGAVFGETGSPERLRQALVILATLKDEHGEGLLRGFTVDVAGRHEWIRDDADAVGTREWKSTVGKLSVGINGSQRDMILDVGLSFGVGARVPSLYQLWNSADDVGSASARPWSLDMERSNNVEISATLLREFERGALRGWEIGLDLFQRNYTDKLRGIAAPHVPVLLYDNVDDARIHGLEARAVLHALDRRVTAEFGGALYDIPDAAAFPFKSENKLTFSLTLRHAGHMLRLFAFRESAQTGVLRNVDGGIAEVQLPSFRNIDISASSTLRVGAGTLTLHGGMRNVLGDSAVELSGLSLRDRRYYVAIAASI